MGELVHNGKIVEATDLRSWLLNIQPDNGAIALDTEGSGLHVDGNWTTDAAKCQPEARVSIVSMAWRDAGALHTLAIPFDQGRIGGKPGRYIKGTGFEKLSHTTECAQTGWVSAGTPGVLKPVCVCAPWNFEHIAWQSLCDWLRGPTVRKVHYFNAKFDMWIMLAGLRNAAHYRCHPDCVGWQHAPTCYNIGVDLSDKLGLDPMVWEGIVDPAHENSLDAVSKKLLGEGKDNGMDAGLKANGPGLGKRYDLPGWAIAARYAAKDAELTLRCVEREVASHYEGLVDHRDLKIIDREHRKTILLFKMEQRGVAFDKDACREAAISMHDEVAKLETELPFQPPNNVQAANYFFGPAPTGLGMLPIKLTPGGKPSCDADVVARLTHEKGPVGEVARAWQHIANMKSVCAKWYDSWPERAGADGRLRANFRAIKTETDRKDGRSGGAVSGRLAVDRIQLQGVPQEWRVPKHVRGIKKKKDGTPGLIQAAPGHQLWEIDASNAEVRVAAWLCDCKALADVINSGVNIHDANTRNIFGIEPDHPDWEKIRTAMKRGIFGTLYCSGVRTLKSQIDADLKDDIPERDIKRFQDELNGAYPELKRTSKRCERAVDVAQGGPGFVRLVSGRRRVFGWGERTYKAMNACIQGGVAEMMSELMLLIEEVYPGILVNQVHDSVWLEIPNAEVDATVAHVRAMGTELFEKAFYTEGMPVAFEFDAKRLA